MVVEQTFGKRLSREAAFGEAVLVRELAYERIEEMARYYKLVDDMGGNGEFEMYKELLLNPQVQASYFDVAHELVNSYERTEMSDFGNWLMANIKLNLLGMRAFVREKLI